MKTKKCEEKKNMKINEYLSFMPYIIDFNNHSAWCRIIKLTKIVNTLLCQEECYEYSLSNTLYNIHSFTEWNSYEYHTLKWISHKIVRLAWISLERRGRVSSLLHIDFKIVNFWKFIIVTQLWRRVTIFQTGSMDSVKVNCDTICVTICDRRCQFLDLWQALKILSLFFYFL